ncbi:MAG TPA: serine--tRNA ligase, partial [Pararhizobium sp.]|nr:serine--tRNA ligase [Pararhizobium sp.]
MLDIKWIRDNPRALDAALKSRGTPPYAERLVELDERRREQIQVLQEMQARRNSASREIGQALREQDSERAEKLKLEVAELKSAMSGAEEESRRIDSEVDDLLASMPNLPLPEVPVGPDESANREERKVGEKPGWQHPAKEHYEIGEALGMMDFEAAAKIAGARFTVLKGPLARL